MKITFWRVVLALVASPAILWAAPPDKLTTMPQVEQFALGPGGTALPGDGTEYCGPTAMTMNIGWLGLAGHSRLAPTTAAEQTPEFFENLDRTLGGLMQAEAYDGTTVSGVVTGVALYMKMKGYEGSFTATTGGIWGPSGNGDGTSGVTIPTWSDLQKVADNTDTALHFGSFLVGWYDVSGTTWAREGGHFLTIVETPTDGTVIINNPYPNPGFPIQQTILLSDVPAGTEGNAGGPNYSLGGALNASDGMQYPNGGSMPPGYNTPVIEQWLDFSVGLTAPEVSTWHLDKGQNVISIGLGYQDVLAPVADSAEGASSFDFYGGGELTFTREATYTGGTTVRDSTLASTVTSGTPFGSGKVTLTRSTLAVRPGGSGSAVSLGLAGGMEFHGGSRLELDRGGNTSLTFQTASLARGTNSTLIIAPGSDSGSAVLGQDVKFLVTGAAPTLSGGMASAAYVGQNTAAGANKSGYFLTYDAANGFVAATTTGGDINSLTGTPIYETSTDQTIASGAAVALTALEVNGAKISGDAGTSISLGAPDLNNGAGLILNGGEVAAGTVDFGNREAFVYASEAGGVISSALQGGRDVNYFGPGTVRVNGASTVAGTTRVLSGTTLLSATGSITGATGVSVSYGATFHQNGTVGSATTAVPLTVEGRRTGVGTTYGNVTVSSTGTFEGGGTVHGNTSVFGVLTNVPDSESPTTAMVFDGDVTFQANALYNWSITNLADISLNPAITVNGTLSFESGSQLGLLFTNATDPTAGNAFWDTDQVFVLALAQSIYNGSNGDNLELNALSYANGYFYFHIGDFSGTEELRLHWVASPVPEPAVGVLVAFGLGVVAWTRLRRRG